MFGLLKRKKSYEQEARLLFEVVHEQSRDAVFYEKLKVPDTTQGRFDILTLHMFIVMHCLKDDNDGQALSQNLFDIAFAEIDRGYREIGVGDMGLPKRMKKLMLGFNGSIHAYEQALNDGNNLKEALRRNIYTLHTGDEAELSAPIEALSDYTLVNIEYLQSQSDASIMRGDLKFKDIDGV